jgi:hypothetical protein
MSLSNKKITYFLCRLLSTDMKKCIYGANCPTIVNIINLWGEKRKLWCRVI